MVVSLGEALIDFIYAEQEGIPSFRPAPGGSPFNTAVALQRLDVPTAFVSRLSRDMFGSMLKEHLETNGVDTSALLLSDHPSTLAFAKIIDKKAEYAFFTNGSADRSITAADIDRAVGSLPEPPKCIQIGSISLALEPGASGIHEYILNRKPGIAVSLDPNIRPSMIADRESYLLRLEELFASADIVKISDEDLAWIYPSSDIRRGAEDILKAGAAACIVTHGIEGSYWFSPYTEAFAPTHPVKVVDTIGAGDTFHAGLIAYLYREGLLERKKLAAVSEHQAQLALTFATHAAEGTCQRQGADPPRLEQVLRLMESEGY